MISKATLIIICLHYKLLLGLKVLIYSEYINSKHRKYIHIYAESGLYEYDIYADMQLRLPRLSFVEFLYVHQILVSYIFRINSLAMLLVQLLPSCFHTQLYRVCRQLVLTLFLFLFACLRSKLAKNTTTTSPTAGQRPTTLTTRATTTRIANEKQTSSDVCIL